MSGRRVLVVDDDGDLCTVLADALGARGFEVSVAHDLPQARAALEAMGEGIALVDVRLGRETGLDIVRARTPATRVLCVVMTAYAATDSAIQALRRGAWDYLRKPFEVDDLLATLERGFERLELEAQKAELARQLEAAQRIESVGRLAGGLAHDLNNMLQPILGYSELLLGELHPSDPRHEFVSEIRHAGQRARDLTTRLLAFGRKQVLELREVRPSEVVEDFRTILHRTLRENVELCFELEAEGAVRGDVAQLEQVLLNLALNAADAMPRGGRLTVATRDARGLAGDPARPCVELAVSDEGAGMDEHTRARIFEPFFSTKGRRGTGLGLSVVLGIVDQHGGTVEVESAPGEGTRVAVRLPQVRGQGRERSAPADVLEEAPRPATPGGGETLLVVEDEPLVRRMTCGFLRRLGYEVLEAADAERALELVRARGGRVDLLLSDVVLPGAGGPELLRRLSGEVGDLPAIFISGHAADAMAAGEGLPPGAELVRKPFSPNDLGERVRAVLDR